MAAFAFKYEREDAIRSLRACAEKLERSPPRRTYDRAGFHPSSDTILRRFFKDWPEAIAAAGLPPCEAIPREWTKADVKRLLLAETKRRGGRPPLSSDWRSATKRRPCTGTVQTLWGSWNAALEACELEVARPRRPHGTWTPEALVEAYVAWRDAHGGKPPTSHAWKARGKNHPCLRTVCDVMGSWGALREAVEAVEAPETPDAALERRVLEKVADAFDGGEKRAAERLAGLIEGLQELGREVSS